MKKIYIEPPYIKLEQALKLAALVSSGGEAKILIQNNEVAVNAKICTQRGKKLFGGDKILFQAEEYEVVINDNQSNTGRELP
jgi:ribosome-associated protein